MKTAVLHVSTLQSVEMNKLSPEELSNLEKDDIENEISYNETYYNQKSIESQKDEIIYNRKSNESPNEEIIEDIEFEEEIEEEADPIKEMYEDALSEYNNGNYGSAKDILTNIIIKEDSADAYYLIGRILYNQEDKMGAISFVKKAIALDPGHEDANEFFMELKK